MFDKTGRFVKGDQIRGGGLCFQSGAQRSQYRLDCTTFEYICNNWRDGRGDGGGRGGRDPRTGEEGGRRAATTTNG